MKVLPAPVVYTWLALSLLLNITGLASIVDGLVIWAKFFGSIVDLYQSRVRDPLFGALLFVWPSFLPQPPRWSADLLVVWSCLYTAFRLFTNFERPEFMFRSLISGPGAFIRQLIYFLLGPLALPYYWLRVKWLRKYLRQDVLARGEPHDPAFDAAVEKLKAERGQEPFLRRRSVRARTGPEDSDGAEHVRRAAFYELVAEEMGRLAPRALLYYGLVAGIFLMVLFANYQLQRAIS